MHHESAKKAISLPFCLPFLAMYFLTSSRATANLTEPLLPFFREKGILKSVDAMAEIGKLKHEIKLLMNTP